MEKVTWTILWEFCRYCLDIWILRRILKTFVIVWLWEKLCSHKIYSIQTGAKTIGLVRSAHPDDEGIPLRLLTRVACRVKAYHSPASALELRGQTADRWKPLPLLQKLAATLYCAKCSSNEEGMGNGRNVNVRTLSPRQAAFYGLNAWLAIFTYAIWLSWYFTSTYLDKVAAFSHWHDDWAVAGCPTLRK